MLCSNHYTLKNTKAIDKPNEDCFVSDDNNGIYIILDGVSRDRCEKQYPNPSPAEQISKIILENIYNEIRNQCKEGALDLYTCILNANSMAKNYNDTHTKIIGDFLAGTVGVVCVISNRVLNYAYIGDCIGKIIESNNVFEFTSKQTLNISKQKGSFSKHEIRNVICNNEKHSCGYGVINGQEGAKYFIKTGSIFLKENSCIILSSDGCEEIFNKASLDELISSSAKQLITKYTNPINADDRTMIIVK